MSETDAFAGGPGSSRPRGEAARRIALGCGLGAVAAAAAAVWLLLPAWIAVGRVAAAPADGPSRVYARPLVVRAGEVLPRGRVREELEALAYREAGRSGEPAPGEFQVLPEGLLVDLRRFPAAGGADPGGPVEVRWVGDRVAAVRRAGPPAVEVSLEPVLLATFLPESRCDRRPLPPGDLPAPLERAVLAAEDDGFFAHGGVSATGIARALWVDLRRGEVVQGGSTITQQLVKNVLLSSERTLSRKVREAVLAALLELRLSKQEILRAYLDTVYLGVREGVGLIGVGAASRAYFGRDPDQLSLAEAATLAGMIAAPVHASPVTHPEHARVRRDRVLRRMLALGWAAREDVEAALARPLETAPAPVAPARAPFAVEPVAAEARERAGSGGLADEGLALLSALDWRDQRAAEDAVRAGLAALSERGHRGLEAAAVSVDPRDGGVRAWVGGRDWRASQFDRAGGARRQAGSAFKPVVFATAFGKGVATPATILLDEPLSVATGGTVWQPRDDDGAFLGPVPARAVLEESRNVPTARLALASGLEDVIATARAMGVEAPLDPVPALALGACAVTPREMATVYATLAAGGSRPAVHLLDAVVGPDGAPRTLVALPERREAVPAAVAFLVTDVLRGVLDRGTGRAARRLGIGEPLAGKTGTSNDGRDAWFAGYSPDRATVVWVGRDDDAPAGISGAGAALPVWARFTSAVRPPGGYAPFVEPPGLVRARVDPASGELATTRCPEVVEELFLAGYTPAATCHLHGGWLSLPVAQPESVPVEKPGFLRRILAKLFGKKPR